MLSFMSPLVCLAFLTRTCLHDVDQFLHFHDSGLFVGQFGTLSQFGSMGLNPQIPGDRGGEFETFQLVPPPLLGALDTTICIMRLLDGHVC